MHAAHGGRAVASADPSVLRAYFASVYREPDARRWSDAVVSRRFASLSWLYHSASPALTLGGAQDFYLANASACGAAACEERGACWPLNSSESHRRPLSAAGQRGLVFCPPVKVRNIHW